jgi:prepilin-type N-terminal cleavage/methylation domain-containing protein
MHQRYSSSREVVRRKGFTLLEAMLSTTIIGVAFVAMLQLLAAGTVNTIAGSELTTGVSLARNMREYTLNQTYTALPALNGASYSPPKDSRGSSVTSLTGWQQVITVQAVNPDNIKQDIVDASPDAVRITVVVNHNSQKVCDLSWYVFDGTP